MSGKSGSPAPRVQSVTCAAVRYPQIGNGKLAGFDRTDGALVAVDPAAPSAAPLP
jgi:hypothetical protein